MLNTSTGCIKIIIHSDILVVTQFVIRSYVALLCSNIRYDVLPIKIVLVTRDYVALFSVNSYSTACYIHIVDTYFLQL